MVEGRLKIEDVRRKMNTGRWELGNGFLHKLPQ
jgi:hypothetical protein